TFTPSAFTTAAAFHAQVNDCDEAETLSSSPETWLIQPLTAPEFSLPDLTGKMWDLRSFRATPLLLQFWATASAHCRAQMQNLEHHHMALTRNGIRIVGVNLDEAS